VRLRLPRPHAERCRLMAFSALAAHNQRVTHFTCSLSLVHPSLANLALRVPNMNDMSATFCQLKDE
jgi:hypothetical protein